MHEEADDRLLILTYRMPYSALENSQIYGIVKVRNIQLYEKLVIALPEMEF